MTMDELIEQALREACIFPPSVTNPHYADKTEMTKGEIILRSLDETGLLPLPEHDAQCAKRIRCIHFVIVELQRRLPDGNITTCGAFRDLGVGCCDQCHTDPIHGMRLLELPGCNWAWLCCAVDVASSPQPYLVLHEREDDPPAGKMCTCKYHNGDRRRED